MPKFLSVSVALALAAPFAALADSPANPNPEIKLLRQEIDALRAAYEGRLQAMEQRLAAAENVAPAMPAPTAAQPVMAPAASANGFNPAMSLILSGGYTRTSRDPAGYRMAGFALPVGAEVGPATRGFTLAESELGLSANIDPWLRGALNLALHPDDTVSVEEAYVQTTALNHGLALKAGRFFSGVGYLNAKHAHTWDFVDNPLAYQAMLGTQYGDDGVQLRWLAPTDQYLELGAELGRGRSFPGGDNARNGAGMAAFTAHTGGDLGASYNWRAGVSVLTAKASGQSLSLSDASDLLPGFSFDGRTRVWVLDGVWKWAPEGNATHTSFKLQGEYLRSTRSGSLGYELAGATVTDGYRAEQSGWYLQGVYQFMPNWRLGLRAERLSPGTPDYGSNPAALANSGYQPRKASVMLDFNASEFSRVRLQLARDQSSQGTADNQLSLQYQMSLGAHGAHGY